VAIANETRGSGFAVMLNDRFIGELFELWILKEFPMPETTDKLGLDTCFVGVFDCSQ